jgi:hypothetical protein
VLSLRIEREDLRHGKPGALQQTEDARFAFGQLRLLLGRQREAPQDQSMASARILDVDRVHRARGAAAKASYRDDACAGAGNAADPGERLGRRRREGVLDARDYSLIP